MDRIQKQRDKIVKRAESSSGVEDLMKVYEKFEEANAITAEYLRLLSPQAHQVNSNKSLLD